jgi:glutathione S-transferase
VIRLSALRWAPPFAQGLVRDLRVRWALEEAGLDYEEMLVGPDEQKSAGYRALQPFGQVPAIDDDGLALFESCAIVMHLGARSQALMPRDEPARARVRTWMLAALNTIEPPVTMLNVIDLQPGGAPAGAKDLRDSIVARICARLDALATFLGEREHLVESRFTAADLLMTTVLRILRTSDLVSQRPTLEAYQQRHEARPAFKKALADQLAVFAKHELPAQ